MFRFDRIGTPRMHGGNLSVGTSTSTIVNSNSSNAQAFVGHVVNAAPDVISGRQAFYWDALLTLPISSKFIVGHQFNLAKKGADNSQGIELSGSIHTTVIDCVELFPIFGELAAAGGSVLASVTINEIPFTLGEGRQAPGTTLRTRSMSYAVPLNLISDDAAGTYFHGFCFSLRDASAASIDRMMLRFGMRTGEPDPGVKDFDIRR